jgi:hypothetical protein
LKEVRNLSFLVQFQQFLVCFLVVYIAFDQEIQFEVFNYVALTCDEVTTLVSM